MANARESASVEEIASAVGGASTDLVRRVFEEYGDPSESLVGQDPVETNGDDGGTSISDDKTKMEADSGGHGNRDAEHVDLTEKQWQTLQAIRDRPGASQRELGELLDVSGATINKRLNSIDGFDWRDRQNFAATVLKNERAPPEREQSSERNSEQSDPDTSSTDSSADQLDTLGQRVSRLENRIPKRSVPSEMGALGPQLFHKVVHACMRADNITEDEELRIISTVLPSENKS